MTKKVHMFGKNGLEKARMHVQTHQNKSLVILKDATGRVAVCNPRLAQDLKAKGFHPVDSEK